MRRVLLALALASALSCTRREGTPDASPAAEAPAMSLPTAALRFETPRGTWVVQVEVARTDPERARGLMFRRELPQDHGMLFVFGETAPRSFWMKNTLLPLDLIFLGEDRAVVDVIERAEPLSLTQRKSKGPARYVLEVLGGEAAAHAVGPGLRAVFVGVPE